MREGYEGGVVAAVEVDRAGDYGERCVGREGQGGATIVGQCGEDMGGEGGELLEMWEEVGSEDVVGGDAMGDKTLAEGGL